MAGETYEKVTDAAPAPTHGVASKPTVVGGWVMDPVVYATEAEAEKAAEDAVTAGSVDAVVLLPTGARFQNLV